MSQPSYKATSPQGKVIMRLRDAMNILANAETTSHDDRMLIKMQTLNFPPLAEAVDENPAAAKEFEKLLIVIYSELKEYFDARKK